MRSGEGNFGERILWNGTFAPRLISHGVDTAAALRRWIQNMGIHNIGIQNMGILEMGREDWENRLKNAFRGRSDREQDLPAINVWVNEQKAILTCEIPGFTASDIEISVEGREVTIAGQKPELQLDAGEHFLKQEREAGLKIRRTVELPFEVAAEGVKAELKDGILTLQLPRHPKEKAQKIEISVS